MKLSREWWFERKDELKALVTNKCPLFIYNDETLNDTFFDLLWIEDLDRLIHTVTANPHPRILEKVYRLGANFKCSSSAELAHLLKTFPGISSVQLLFSSDLAGPEDYEYSFKRGVTVMLENISSLRSWPDVFKNRDIFLCIKIGHDQDDHNISESGQASRKSGIMPSEIKSLVHLLNRSEVSVKGLHAQLENTASAPPGLNETASFLAGLSGHFPEVSVLSFGSGIGLSMKSGQGIPDIPATKENLHAVRDSYPQFKLWLQPGHRIVSHAGVLLTKVTQAGRQGGIACIRLNTGMGMLTHSAVYGLHYDIINFSRLNEKATMQAHIMGQDDDPKNAISCVIRPAPVEEGDILLITNTGSYVPGTKLGSDSLDSVPAHYLCARKMCPVRI